MAPQPRFSVLDQCPLSSMASLPIEPLDLETRTQLRSTQILTSLPQIVSELFQNSLDAGARQICIGVNREEWGCWVSDDGHGMGKEDLAFLGKEGRYGTSKAYTPDSLNALSTFGFRGEALASAAKLCCLEIASRTSQSRDTWSIIMKEGSVLYTGSAVRWRRESHGTTVCIRDAFHNLPVRRLSHPSSSRTLELIRQELEAYAIAHPDVSFSLEDTYAKESGSTKFATFRIPKTTSSLAAFRHLYGRALCQHVEEINIISGDLRLEGFISLEGAISKTYQFLYVNRHPIPSSDLRRVIDSKFAASSFAKNAFDENGMTELPRNSARRSPRKTVKQPVYVLNLTIPPHQVDNMLEPAKTALHLQDKAAVATFLSASIGNFLIKHGFSTADTSKGVNDSSSFSKRRRIEFEDDSEYTDEILDRSPRPRSEELNLERRRMPLYIRPDEHWDNGDNELFWTDDTTGQTFVVNARTGNSRPQTQPRHWSERPDEAFAPRGQRQRRTLSLPLDTAKDSASAAPEWIREALEANDTYSLAERRIPALNVSSHTNTEAMDKCIGYRGEHHYCAQQLQQSQPLLKQQQSYSKFFLSGKSEGDSGGHTQDHFTKAHIQSARVISQVDRKFVACLFDNRMEDLESTSERTHSRPTLVLIDQHAADERIRVERYLKDLCLGFLRSEGVEVRQMTHAIPILLTRHEALLLAGSPQIEDAFRNWGIRFAGLNQVNTMACHETDGDGESSGYVQIMVQCVPEVVADKLLLGDELRDLVKGYIAQVGFDMPDTSPLRDATPETAASEFDWLKALRWCPRELLELVNSKACRGAIMFNDSLTHEQCERLVRQLSETAFPFQCAHGRPSLVPLAKLGKLSGTSGRVGQSRIRWPTLEEQSNLV